MANDRDSKKFIPKPPEAPKSSNNLYTRKNVLKHEDETDKLSEILNTSLTPRPLSSRLSKYQTLPGIGTKLDLILIGIRLPDGTKIQKEFRKTDKISTVLEYAFNEFSKIDSNILVKSDFTLLQMPNLKLSILNQTLEGYNISNRSMLFLISNDKII